MLLLPFQSPQAWATAAYPPINALVLLRKSSPAIMFCSHFLHLQGWREAGSHPMPGTVLTLIDFYTEV